MSSVSYWSVWNVPQPSRSSHWFSCKKCVWTYDHHSIWINNWVGEQNRRSFLLALILISIQLFMGTVLTFTRLDNDSTFSAHVVLWLIISVITEMFFLPITMTMIIFQLYLVRWLLLVGCILPHPPGGRMYFMNYQLVRYIPLPLF